MKRFLPLIAAIATLSVFSAEKKPNVLLICVDDLRPELACFGVDYIQSPHIDSLAAQGRAFARHYVQAPTCGASRNALLMGRYGGDDNSALFVRSEELGEDGLAHPPSMPAWFRQHGYQTVSVGKVSHHPGGLGGPDWDDAAILEMPNAWDRHILKSGPWQHPRGWMHGLANGEIRFDANDMDVMQALDGPDAIYPDGTNTDEAIKQLDKIAKDDQPFFLAFGILRPHLPFGAPAKYLELYKNTTLPKIVHPEKPTGRTTWHRSGEFYKYNRWGKDPNTDAEFSIEVRKHYAACVSYADAQVGKIVDRLEALGLRDDTIIVLWGDHGWHLGEHSIWGKHALFEESLLSPLIVSYPGIPNAGAITDAIVESVDIFPTLAELAHLPTPDYASGVSVVPLLKEPDAQGHNAYGYFKGGQTVRTDTHRLIVHEDGYLELYDHTTPEGETKNIAAAQPELAQTLLARINWRLGN